MDFWHVHGVVFLISMALFPRLTMLIATTAPFTLFHWLGWLFAPRLTGAILATTFYWQSNTPLCILAWIFALGIHDIQVRQYGKHMRQRYRRTVIYVRHKYF